MKIGESNVNKNRLDLELNNYLDTLIADVERDNIQFDDLRHLAKNISTYYDYPDTLMIRMMLRCFYSDKIILLCKEL